MLLDAALKLMLFGMAFTVVAIALLVLSLMACIYALLLWRSGKHRQASVVLLLAVPVAVGLPSAAAYFMIDHREHRDLSLDFRKPQPDVIRMADSACDVRPLNDEVEDCRTSNYINNVSIRLGDGAELVLQADQLSWRTHKRHGLTYFGFWSNNSITAEQAMALLEADAKRLSDVADKHVQEDVASLRAWLQTCVVNGSKDCSLYQGASLRMQPLLRIWFHKTYDGQHVTAEYEVYTAHDRTDS